MPKFRNPITVQGALSLDLRRFDNFEFRDMPLPLRWDRMDDGAHAGAEGTGVLQAVHLASAAEKTEFGYTGPGELWIGEGEYLDVSAAPDAITLAKAGVGFISVDPGGAYEYHFEIKDEAGNDVDMKDVYKAQDKIWYGEDDDGSAEEWLRSLQEWLIFDQYLVGGITQVDIPCFPECRMVITEDSAEGAPAGEARADGAPAGPGGVNRTPDQVMGARTVLRRLAAGPSQRPASFYAKATYDRYTPWSITEEGEFVGHLCGWNACHRGFQNRCEKPAYQTSFDDFHTGWVALDNGERMRVGVITHTEGHLRTAADFDRVAGNPACQLGSARLYADKWGIQVRGSAHPDVKPETITRSLAGSPSGDWRGKAGARKLFGIAIVNTPGYTAYGDEDRMIASIPPPPPEGVDMPSTQAFFDVPASVLQAACPCKAETTTTTEHEHGDCGCGGTEGACTCADKAAASPTPDVLLGLAQLDAAMKLREAPQPVG